MNDISMELADFRREFRSWLASVEEDIAQLTAALADKERERRRWLLGIAAANELIPDDLDQPVTLSDTTIAEGAA